MENNTNRVLIPESWNDYGMDWENPDPFDPVYYNAITAALMERIEFFGNLLQMYKKHYGRHSRHYNPYFQPLYFRSMTPFLIAEFIENLKRYAAMYQVFHCQFTGGTYQRFASLQVPLLPTTVTGGICYSGNVLQDWLKRLRKWVDRFCYFGFVSPRVDAPINIVYGYKRVDYRLKNEVIGTNPDGTFKYKYTDEEMYSMFLEQAEEKLKNAEVVILKPPENFFVWCYLPETQNRIYSVKYEGVINSISCTACLPLYSVIEDHKYQNVQIGFRCGRLLGENVFHDFGIGYEPNTDYIIKEPYFNEEIKMYDPLHNFSFQKNAPPMELLVGMDYVSVGFTINESFENVYLDYNCEGGFKFRPDA